MKKTKKQNGITLVALVITIIILLILATISVQALTNTGLFAKAQESKEKTQNATENQSKTLNEYEDELNKYIPGETSKTYQVGDVVKIGEEEFYVIADKGTTVELLAKYVLNAAATEQENADTDCAFSTSNYWGNETLPSSSPYFNLNTYSAVQNDTGSAVYKANNYAKSLGAKSGRLLTYEEANILKDSYSDIIFVTYGNSKYYWLGSVYNSKTVWKADGNSNNLSGTTYNRTTNCGVRPVIEISKSAIE